MTPKEKNLDLQEPLAFADPVEFLEFLEGPRVWPYRSSEEKNSNKKWALGVDFEGAKKMLFRGWPQGAAKISALQASTGFETKSRRKITPQVSGFLPIVPAYLAGDPRAMWSRPRKPLLTPIVHLVVGMSASSFNEGGRFVNYGVALLSLVQTLEAQGLQCKLTWGGIMGKRYMDEDSPHLRFEVPVKEAGQPLDLERLAFIVAHPAMFRRLFFAAAERSTKVCCEALGNWYGYPKTYVSILADGHVVPGMQIAGGRMDTPDGAIKYILDWWEERVKTLHLSR